MFVEAPAKERKTRKNRPKNRRRKPDSNGAKPPIKNHGKRVKKKKSRLPIPHIAPWKIILGAIILGGVGFLYLHHVFATQKLLHKVQNMEQQYKQAKRSHKKVKMEYDRLTGPVEITKKPKKWDS